VLWLDALGTRDGRAQALLGRDAGLDTRPPRLDGADWLEAFRAHPKIGETKAAAKVSEQERRWSEGEQARAQESPDATRAALAEANREYEERFGFIFIIRASGRTAEEILAALRARITNERDTELRVAADEQWNITELRLRKFFDAA
jgi:OHCU decarboxylase